jgi:enoyl-CoA hydratase/carnithine racemase
MLYSGEQYDAVQARSMGLLDEIRDDVGAAAVEYAGTLAGNAPLSIAGAKFMLNTLSMGDGSLDVAAAQRMIDVAPIAKISGKAGWHSPRSELPGFADVDAALCWESKE